MTPILYARHGESTWNAAGRWQGQADPPLSRRGREQAKALAERLLERLGGTGIGLLATSPLARARETAAIVAERLGTPARWVAGLRELDAGSWSGLTRAEVERRFPRAIARFRAGDLELRAGGEGESRRELRVRVVAALRGLVAEQPGLPLVVVGHLGALRTLVPDARLGNAELLELPAAILTDSGAESDSGAGLRAAAPAARAVRAARAMGDER